MGTIVSKSGKYFIFNTKVEEVWNTLYCCGFYLPEEVDVTKGNRWEFKVMLDILDGIFCVDREVTEFDN